jgi:hypothetical protein
MDGNLGISQSQCEQCDEMKMPHPCEELKCGDSAHNHIDSHPNSITIKNTTATINNI